MLCEKCHNIDFTLSALVSNTTPQYYSSDNDEEGSEYYLYSHHPSLESLFNASELGCHLCRQIRQELFHIRGHESEEPHHHGPLEIRQYKDADQSKISYLKGLQVVAKTPMRDVKISFDLVKHPSFLSDLLKEKAFNNNPSIGCEENFKIAGTWLHQCLTSHALCTISVPPSPPLPSRILDVECPKSISGLSLCSSGGRHGPYLSLSHVWGRTQIITTTLRTLETRMKTIPIEDLSKTFQDAVVLARQLSIRYLWIDSLCIIQDSSDDWRTESSKMGEYYMNALFNIAAVSSSNGNGGCFLARDVLALTPCPISIKFPEGTPETSSQVFIRPSIGWDPVNEIAGLQRPPLWHRAWVIQERLLSPRTLQFSSMQMSWRCRVSEASERVPEMCALFEGGQVDRLFHDTLFGLKKFEPKLKFFQPLLPGHSDCPRQSKDSEASSFGTKEELLNLYNAWYDLVTLYGKCFLSQSSDIFPAISGIARAIALSVNDRYISGLWRHDLHRGLLWSAPDSTVSKPDLRHSRAPSWSWAALSGTCNFYARQISQKGVEVKVDMLEIEGTGERTSGVDTFGGFGSVEEVVLVVRGKLKKANPGGLEGDAAFHEFDGGGETLFDLEGSRAVGFYFADNADRKYLTEIWCLPVMTEQRLGSGSGESGEQISRPVEGSCLALLCLSKERNIYMRVGSAWVTEYSWFDGVDMSLLTLI